MFISDEEFVRRITSEDNLVTRRGAHGADLVPCSDFPPAIELDLEALLDIRPTDSGEPKTSPGEKKSFRIPRNLDTPSDYKGRGTKHLHRDVQAGIGVTSALLGPTVAKNLNDVSLRGAFAYQRGHTTPSTVYERSPKEDLLNKIIQGHGIVADKCFTRLLKTLDLLDDAALEREKRPIQLSIIAKNLSNVIATATAATKEHVLDSREQSVHFHIMRPEQAEEKEYPTIEISSAPPPDQLPE